MRSTREVGGVVELSSGSAERTGKWGFSIAESGWPASHTTVKTHRDTNRLDDFRAVQSTHACTEGGPRVRSGDKARWPGGPMRSTIGTGRSIHRLLLEFAKQL